MKQINLKMLVLFLFTVFLFSCSEKEPLMEEMNQLPKQEIPVGSGEEIFVSLEQALEIAGKFLSSESGVETRALENVSVETIKDEENGSNPAMYVVNYPEGGWVITSATRNYFPVLAHSDKGSFNLENVSQSGVSVWMAETKDAVRLSKDLADSVKVQINTQWLAYEETKIKVPSVPQTRTQADMDTRMMQLSLLYPGQWSYMNLNDAQFYLDSYAYQNIINMANTLGATLQYTIIGIRGDYVPTSQNRKGPLLTTEWGQWYPFNYICPPNTGGSTSNYPAGCVAVAVGQIMRYHKKPALVNNPYNHQYNWDNMPDKYNGNNATDITASSIPLLLLSVGYDVNMQYSANGSGSSIDLAENAFEYLHYYADATIENHNANAPSKIQANINANRPVYMKGQMSNGSQHAWVCDGVTTGRFSTEFFVEFYVYNSYTDYYGNYTPSSPGSVMATYPSCVFYNMNWGWSGENNGWYTDNSFPSGNNYQYLRENLYITP
ncbi:MAG: C10 family peptidase [Bacteroidales bacterium]|nr:C10 family peptidase [Bacteroidales bacterium]